MKVLNVSEILTELELTVSKKEDEKKQILDIRNSLNKVIDLERSLSGSTGEAIKEHFTVLHVPALILFNQFLDEYINQLKEIQNILLDYESENGVVSQDFIEYDVKQGLEKLDRLTEDVIESINHDFSKVSDLVSASPLSMNLIHSSVEQARRHNHETVENLAKTDYQGSNILQPSIDQIQNISELIGNIKGWSKGGVVLSESTIKEINKYFTENDFINKLIDSATELSEQQNDSTMAGNVADWLDKMGKMNGGMDALKGTMAASILLSKRIILTRDGKGNFIVKAHPDWIKGKNGAYGSKLANTIHGILKKGSSSSISSIQNYFSKFQNAPSRMLRHLAGLNPGTNLKSYKKILEHQHPYLKFSPSQTEVYKRAVLDLKGTASQVTDMKAVKAIARKIPYAGILFSIGTNSGEFFSDQNKNKSVAEKVGRATAGIGMDVGVAGMTTGGAFIGTLICPGPGTLIGGAIGATAGIVASINFEDQIKDIGEKAGKWSEEKIGEVKETFNNTVDDVKDKVSGVGDFVSGLFN
ncbi:T7SS effector LXG polymorphic toxin [Rossellomorea vietnamensis]|uniref:T7SS effector LXG polymorphic toxin n=1 Tax=Rossellomorea vietnamensis TaxID=218284 RepID=A0ACD4C2Y3_9BACI|nr:T7SS effector LXG polymorphic toxin [Rossellomorea vietnamensis]UXH42990.1 T7SS effector LXG polymorphic toxin [Rossellomorea vietnamensis]